MCSWKVSRGNSDLGNPVANHVLKGVLDGGFHWFGGIGQQTSPIWL